MIELVARIPWAGPAWAPALSFDHGRCKILTDKTDC
jgi:hypothetical protein